MFEKYPAWNHETRVAAVLCTDSRPGELWEGHLPGAALRASQRVVVVLGPSGGCISEEKGVILLSLRPLGLARGGLRGGDSPPPRGM